MAVGEIAVAGWMTRRKIVPSLSCLRPFATKQFPNDESASSWVGNENASGSGDGTGTFRRSEPGRTHLFE